MKANSGKRNKIAILIAVVCLSVALCSTGVYAYLSAKTDPVTNEFVPAKVSCVVEETFQDGVKSNVTVRNTGNIDAYIRAAVVVNFVSDDGKFSVVTPKEGVDYTVTWGATGWRKGTDGYWYYANAVVPEALTAPLIETAAAVSAPTDFRLNIRIIAAAIQSAPDDAVQDAWGITPTNGELIPN